MVAGATPAVDGSDGGRFTTRSRDKTLTRAAPAMATHRPTRLRCLAGGVGGEMTPAIASTIAVHEGQRVDGSSPRPRIRTPSSSVPPPCAALLRTSTEASAAKLYRSAAALATPERACSGARYALDRPTPPARSTSGAMPRLVT